MKFFRTITTLKKNYLNVFAELRFFDRQAWRYNC